MVQLRAARDARAIGHQRRGRARVAALDEAGDGGVEQPGARLGAALLLRAANPHAIRSSDRQTNSQA
jgi:hypothetical protein